MPKQVISDRTQGMGLLHHSLPVDLTPGSTVHVKLAMMGYDTIEFDYLVPDADEMVTKTMIPVTPGVITCDTNPYASLGLDTGCKLLLHYDLDNDGKINLDELTQSHSDYETGIITEEEFDFVSDCYLVGKYVDGEWVRTGRINHEDMCPGCWEAPPKKMVTFESVPAGATVEVLD